MNLRIRRVVYTSFIAAFIIITPLITLYATGYSYNFKKNKIEKIGIILIESQPKNAQIYINGEYRKNTPARFARVLPDSYEVKVSKEGYYSWERKLHVQSNLTTFAKDIVLFKNNLPINVIEGEVNIFTLSPDQSKLIYSLVKDNTEELRLLNLKNNSDSLIKEFNIRSYNDLVVDLWSKSQNKLILRQAIGDFNKYLIVEADSLKVKELFDITRINFDTVRWGNDNTIYGLRKAVLHKIDLINNSTQTLLSANITDFQIKNEKILYIEKIAKESFLNQIHLVNNEKVLTEKIKLPALSQFTLHESPSPYISLIDQNNQDLFIIKDTAFTNNITENTVLQGKAKNMIWSKDLKNILYYDDFEISIFNLKTGNKNLITRYGDIIDQALWYNDKYIIYKINNSIKVIEATNDEHKNDLVLSALPEIKKITLDGEGKNIYIEGRAGAQAGIYKLEIQ